MLFKDNHEFVEVKTEKMARALKARLVYGICGGYLVYPKEGEWVNSPFPVRMGGSYRNGGETYEQPEVMTHRFKLVSRGTPYKCAVWEVP